MSFTNGLLGTVGEPGKVITACTEVNIFIIDAWELRVPLSRLRITVKPEPSIVPYSTNVYSIQEVSGPDNLYRLVYNCRHDQLTDVDDCSACDKGTVLDNATQINRVMFDEKPMQAMKWLSRRLTAIGGKGYVKMEPGLVREIQWWQEHPEEKPHPTPIFDAAFFGADRTPIPWDILCAERYNFDNFYPLVKPESSDRTRPGGSTAGSNATRSNATRSNAAGVNEAGGNTAAPQPAQQPPTSAQNAAPSEPYNPSALGRSVYGARELYWDPVYDSHDQNVEPNCDDWPDEFPPIAFFPMRAW